MTVWIVVGNWVTEDDMDSFVSIYDSEDKAKRSFKECIAEEIQHDWYNELPDRVVESDDRFWTAYENGNYNLNHVEYYYERREVR